MFYFSNAWLCQKETQLINSNILYVVNIAIIILYQEFSENNQY